MRSGDAYKEDLFLRISGSFWSALPQVKVPMTKRVSIEPLPMAFCKHAID